MPAPSGRYQLYLAISHLKYHQPEPYPCRYHRLPLFRKAQKYRVAWGIRHLLDNVPHKCAAPMRNQLVGHFGKTTYYRFYRQEQGLFPKAQAYIRQVFKQYGIAEEPKFERYSEEYSYNDWSIRTAQLLQSLFLKNICHAITQRGISFDYKPIKAWKIPVIDKNLHNHPSRHNKSSIRYLLHSPQNSAICLVLSMKLLVS